MDPPNLRTLEPGNQLPLPASRFQLPASGFSVLVVPYNEAAMTTPRISGLYVIIDPEACGARDPVEVARLALEGGASIVQWRDKRRDKGEQLPQARAVRELCAQHDALFIVNDHVDLALVVGAD